MVYLLRIYEETANLAKKRHAFDSTYRCNKLKFIVSRSILTIPKLHIILKRIPYN